MPYEKSTIHSPVTVGIAEGSFPVPNPNTDAVKQPGGIFVQSDPNNTGEILIGKTGITVATREQAIFVLNPGGSGLLPVGIREEDLKHIASIADQKLLVTYLQGEL